MKRKEKDSNLKQLSPSTHSGATFKEISRSSSNTDVGIRFALPVLCTLSRDPWEMGRRIHWVRVDYEYRRWFCMRVVLWMPSPNTEASPAIYPSPEHTYVRLETKIITNRLRLVLNEITVFTHELFCCDLGVNLNNPCTICHIWHYSYLGSTILNACIENEKCMKNGMGILTDQLLSNASYSVLGSGKKRDCQGHARDKGQLTKLLRHESDRHNQGWHPSLAPVMSGLLPCLQQNRLDA